MNKKRIRPLARLHGYWIWKTFLARTQEWPQERRQAYVFERLKRTLISANEGVPFYRERFQKAGFDPSRDFQHEGDLAHLPLLTKEDVRNHSQDMIDRRFTSGSVEANTSGTTGQPMMMRLNESYVALDYACMFRFWEQAGYRFRAPFAAIRSYVPSAPDQPLWKFNWWQNTLYLSAYHLRPSNCDSYVEALLRFKPLYLRGYPSSMTVLAQFAFPQREKLDFVRGIFTASETVLPSERETIERTFGKKLFDWYGMTEPAVVITERADHDGMEVNWEYGFPEFLAAPQSPSDECHLITTSLHNPVMPFIRYDTGDMVKLAAPSAAPSAAPGEIYPRVRAIMGRKDECILTPDGGRLPSLNFYSLLQTYTDILRFQFLQVSLGEIIMKIMLRPGMRKTDVLLASLRAEVMKRLGPSITLTIELTDQFVCSPDGKTPTFKRTFIPPPPASAQTLPSLADR